MSVPSRSAIEQATTRSMSVSMLMPVWSWNSRCPFLRRHDARGASDEARTPSFPCTSAYATTAASRGTQLQLFGTASLGEGAGREPDVIGDQPGAEADTSTRSETMTKYRVLVGHETALNFYTDRRSRRPNYCSSTYSALLDRPRGEPQGNAPTMRARDTRLAANRGPRERPASAG